jgi:PPP family 3-phenylpropionic acid transporter
MGPESIYYVASGLALAAAGAAALSFRWQAGAPTMCGDITPRGC